MKYITLPGTDLEVSRIAFGNWGLAGPPHWHHVDMDEAVATIRRAFDAGITFFDTAPVYGMGTGELQLGKAFKGMMKDVVVATKVGLRWKDKTAKGIYHDNSGASIRWEVEQSLQRLGVETIDLYQVHWPHPETPMEDTYATLDALQKEGKIRFIGMSNYGVEHIKEAQQYAKISTLQPRFNMLDRNPMASLLPFCDNQNIGTLIYSPLASGLLTGKYDRNSMFTDWRSFSFADLFQMDKRDTIILIVEALKSIAEDMNISLTQLTMQWTLAQRGVSTVLAGIRKADHIPGNVAAGATDMDSETIARINKVLDDNPL
jgi:aryl-alcohol dehydrogenase-like predicted oxidoreductase